MLHDTPNPNALETKLIHAGALNLDDLPFNQAGELSPRQRRWLMVEVAAWGVQVGINLIAVVIIWCFFFRFQLQSDAHTPWGLVAFFWSALIGLNAFICLITMQPVWLTIKNNEVKSITGVISKNYEIGSIRWRTGIVSWFLNVKDQTFKTSQTAHAVIIDHRKYRLFYIPALHNRLLNIEPLFSADDDKQSHLSTLQNRARETKE